MILFTRVGAITVWFDDRVLTGSDGMGSGVIVLGALPVFLPLQLECIG